MAAPPVFWRSPRLKQALPVQEIEIPEPPIMPASSNNSLLYVVLPLAIVGITMTGVALFMNNMAMLAFSLPMILASGVGSVVVFQMQKRAGLQQAADRTRLYHAFLLEQEEALRRLYREQHSLRIANDPDPQGCLRWVTTRDRNLWARVPTDDDFLSIRLGLGHAPSSVVIKAPSVREILNPDPLVVEAQQLAQRYSTLSSVPVCVNVREAMVIGVGGDRSDIVNTAFLMLIQLATHHAPSEVKLAAIFPASEKSLWAWLRWLPHTWQDDRRLRYLAGDEDEAHLLLAKLERVMDARRRQINEGGTSHSHVFSQSLVLFLANPDVVEHDPTLQRIQLEGPALGLYLVFLASRTKALPASCRAVVRVTATQADLIRPGVSTSSQSINPDRSDSAFAIQYAQDMAPLRLKQLADRTIPSTVSLLQLFDVDRVEELNVAQRWQTSAIASRTLAVPIGLAAGSEPLLLDLHERADGPNGLVAGTVGAGKSELLQTLVASLAIHFHPHRLAFVLVDYKGGGMADPFVDLPHTLGVITNLQQENLALRALTSFRVELERRQRMLDEAGVNHIDDYQKRYYEGKITTQPLPYLLVIVDEFAEMKTEQPDVAREFVRIARVGRSLGLRLVLAMQKPSGIVDGQIEANTRFRLCLRVAQTEDSQAMLKRPDAAFLSGTGRAYLQIGANEVFREFQVAWGGALYEPQKTTAGDPLEITAIELNGARRVMYSPAAAGPEEERSQLQACIQHLLSTAAQLGIVRQDELWQQPLPEKLTLDRVRPAGGWDGAVWQPVSRWLAPVVGLVDEPRQRRQYPLEVNLGKEGHIAVYSAPGYGKTIFLQTLITSLVLTYSPDEVNLYLLDFSSRLLRRFEEFPHVGAVIAADETERLERLQLLLYRKLEDRRNRFAEVGASTLLAYRQLTSEPEPAIIVVLDNFANFLETIGEDETALNAIARLAREGSNYGIHLVLTANNSTTIRFGIASNIALAIVLHLVERSEYGAIVGRIDDLKLAAVPGRGIVRGNPPLECQIAVPVAGDNDAEWTRALSALAEQMHNNWRGLRPKRVNKLDETVPLSAVFQAERSAADVLRLGSNTGKIATSSSHPSQTVIQAVPIGLHVDDLTQFRPSLEIGQHYLVTGAQRSGKSTLLRTWVYALISEIAPVAVRIFVIDSARRSLVGLRTLPHVVAFSGNSEETDRLLDRLRAEFSPDTTAGTPGATVSGAPVVLLVDDGWDAYDSTLGDAAKERLAELIRQTRSTAFHMLAAGRTSDLVHRGWDESLKTLRETQNGFILGSGDDSFFSPQLPYQERSRLLPIGEGYFLQRSYVRRVKIAVADEEIVRRHG